MKPLEAARLAIAPSPHPLPDLPREALPRVRLYRPARLAAADLRRWRALTDAAAPGNVFAQDWIMEPAMRHCGQERSLRLAVVEDSAGMWLGALPLTLEARIGRCPVPSLHGWHAANQFIGTPLVRAGAERTFWQAMLAHLDRHPGLALGLYCPAMPTTDAVSLALAVVCAQQGRAVHTAHSFTRPARFAGKSFADPKAARKLARRLDGLERRLAAAHGAVRLLHHDGPEDCEPWLAAFLALERAGWKGRTKSALASCARTSGLFRDVIREGRRRGLVRLASLSAGETIVAMSCWFVADSLGYGFKMAYDEQFRSFAPGRLLMRRVAALAEAEAVQIFDTCAVPDAPDDPLWPDRRAFGGLAVAIGGPLRRALFDRLMHAQARRQRGTAEGRPVRAGRWQRANSA